MYGHTRLTVDIKKGLYKEFIEAVGKSNYSNASDAMRDFVRKFVEEGKKS